MNRNIDPYSVLQCFEPDGQALLALLRPHISEDMLVDIANTDYGYDAEQHMVALKKLWRTGVPEVPIQWEPEEVLELVRWSRPDSGDPYWKPLGKRGHLMRLFSCAALLRAGGDKQSDGYLLGENQTVAIAIESARTLDAEFCTALSRFIAWRLSHTFFAGDVERPFFILGLLLLHILKPYASAPNSITSRVAQWLIEEEQGPHDEPPNTDQWLFGLIFFDQSTDIWKSLACRAKKIAMDWPSSKKRDCVLHVADKLINADGN